MFSCENEAFYFKTCKINLKVTNKKGKSTLEKHLLTQNHIECARIEEHKVLFENSEENNDKFHPIS